MTKIIELTAEEIEAAVILAEGALDNIGGARPEHFERDLEPAVSAASLAFAGIKSPYNMMIRLLDAGVLEEKRGIVILTDAGIEYLKNHWDAFYATQRNFTRPATQQDNAEAALIDHILSKI